MHLYLLRIAVDMSLVKYTIIFMRKLLVFVAQLEWYTPGLIHYLALVKVKAHIMIDRTLVVVTMVTRMSMEDLVHMVYNNRKHRPWFLIGISY